MKLLSLWGFIISFFNFLKSIEKLLRILYNICIMKNHKGEIYEKEN